MENFLLPSKVEFQPGETMQSGTVVITSCFHGYGTTLGNAYRRVLLSSLPGSAVEYFKIKGIQHEFSTVEGVKEDVVEIMLNLKQLAVKTFGDEMVILRLEKKGPGPVTAGDFEPNAQAEIINKDLILGTLTKNKTLEMEVAVGRGRGYQPVEEKDRQNYDLGTIVVDSVYTPVKDVGYHVEFTRVGDITNYEKLTISIETNGTISPRESLRQATQILMDHFSIVMRVAEQAAPEELKYEAAAPAETATEASGEEGKDKTGEKEKKKKKITTRKKTKSKKE